MEFGNKINLGRLVVGHVLDVNRKHFVRKLQDYDKQLYTRWNPTKNNGYGCWEIRRKPERPTLIYCGMHEGYPLYKLEYVEDRMIHHVLDSPYLHYKLLERIQEMDTWTKYQNGLDDWEYKERKRWVEEDEKSHQELKYALRQHKKTLAIFKDAVTSGYRPDDFFKGIYDKDHEDAVFHKKLK